MNIILILLFFVEMFPLLLFCWIVFWRTFFVPTVIEEQTTRNNRCHVRFLCSFLKRNDNTILFQKLLCCILSVCLCKQTKDCQMKFFSWGRIMMQMWDQNLLCKQTFKWWRLFETIKQRLENVSVNHLLKWLTKWTKDYIF